MTRPAAQHGPASPAGRRVTVVGLGRFGGGVGVTRWLCRQGAHVTVSDKAGAGDLAASLEQLRDVDPTLHLGEHRREDFLRADLLVVNPAVPPDLPELAEADRAGVPRTTEINLFLERCPAPVAAVTGTVGKSTTTAMLGAILSADRPTHVGGNIGRSLLGELDAIRPDHVVVLELSSFQLEELPRIARSPHVAVVTNLAPNHLDRHGTLAAYAEAKKNIFRFQGPRDVLVLNAACNLTRQWADEAPGRVVFFEPAPVGRATRCSRNRNHGKASREQQSCLPYDTDPQSAPFDLAVPGAHNQANAQAAWTAARQLGVGRAVAAAALAEFHGLPHRLQFVAERDGVRYVNDSKCTTPEGVAAALEAFGPRRAVLIAGGYDKGVDLAPLARAAATRAKAVVLLGATAERIAADLAAARSISPGRPADRTGAASHAHGATYDMPVERAGDLPDAVTRARGLAEPGDVVLLCPGCASYDQFANYEQRGEAFAELADGSTPATSP